MLKHQSKRDNTCPVARSVDLIGDRWSLLIVRNAFDGSCRFSDFQRELGVARSILTDRLRKLVDAGIFTFQPASDGTSYQEYVLTSAGKRLFPILVALRQWGEQHLFNANEVHSELIETTSGKPIAIMLPIAQDGHVLLPEETFVKKD